MAIVLSRGLLGDAGGTGSELDHARGVPGDEYCRQHVGLLKPTYWGQHRWG
jgi:hypothetical protein